jgi:hypothetical protein
MFEYKAVLLLSRVFGLHFFRGITIRTRGIPWTKRW